MLLLKILILIILSLVFIQDMRTRSVYWIMFPLLIIGLVALRYFQTHNFGIIWRPVVINASFIMVLLILVSAYFSFKKKKLTYIIDYGLGLGDVLLLFSIIFYLSPLNFLFFYIFSSITVLVVWPIWQLLSSKKNKEIPLAGLQAMIFILFLVGDWWVKLFDLTDDTWLLNLIAK